MTGRVRVGLIGTGVIAQVMHLHYLAELADRFEVAAVCDLDGEGAAACAQRYGVPAVFTDWRDLLGHPVSRGAARAACQRDHPFDPEQRRQPDRVAQRLIVLPGYIDIWMQRIAPRGQRVDPQPVPADPGQPGRAGLAVAQQDGHVAVRVRRVPAGPDLQVGHLGRGPAQPARDLLERPVEESLEHDADPQPRLPSLVGRHRRSASRRPDRLPIADLASGVYDLSRVCEYVQTSEVGSLLSVTVGHTVYRN